MDPTELERLVDDALTRLPAPRAPRTLLPRVMQAVRLAEAQAAEPATLPWYAWPRGWQVGSAAALMVLVAGALYFWPLVFTTLSPAAVPEAKQAGSVLDGLRVIWRVAQPAMTALVVFVSVMGLMCAAGAAALRRVAS